jgi:hypothetical protein
MSKSIDQFDPVFDMFSNDTTAFEDYIINRLRRGEIHVRDISANQQTPRICEEIIKLNPCLISWIRHPTEELCIKAVRLDPLAYVYMRDPSPAVTYEAISRNGLLLEKIPNHAQTEDLCVAAVVNNESAFEYVDERKRTSTFYMRVLEHNPYVLPYIPNPSPMMELKAISACGAMIKYVKNQTRIMCLTAVQQDGLALEFIKNQTEEIIKAALQQNPEAIKYAKPWT